MSDKPTLDMDRIAAALGAERKGKVRSSGGYFGAVQLAADVQARFRTPTGGGRSTNPAWTERRLLPLAPATLQQLECMSRALGEQGVKVTPLQLAALVLERAMADADEEAIADLAKAS